MRDVLDLLFRLQRELGVRLLIIGGWALQAHGYARNTVDVDCMVSAADDQTVADRLRRVGFECFDEQVAFRRFKHNVDPFLVVDVMRVSAETFEKMWNASVLFQVAGLELHVPSLLHLIALKLHAATNEHRAGKDLEDIRQLLAANPGALSSADLETLCNRFGTLEHLNSLKAWLQAQ
jgi:hypothetical protein